MSSTSFRRPRRIPPLISTFTSKPPALNRGPNVFVTPPVVTRKRRRRVTPGRFGCWFFSLMGVSRPQPARPALVTRVAGLCKRVRRAAGSAVSSRFCSASAGAMEEKSRKKRKKEPPPLQPQKKVFPTQPEDFFFFSNHFKLFSPPFFLLHPTVGNANLHIRCELAELLSSS